MDCRECKKYKSCKSLCKEAEKYVSQDHISQSEFVSSYIIENTLDNYYTDEYSYKKLTDGQIDNIIIALFLDGKSQDEIAYHVPKSISYIWRTIKKYRGEKG